MAIRNPDPYFLSSLFLWSSLVWVLLKGLLSLFGDSPLFLFIFIFFLLLRSFLSCFCCLFCGVFIVPFMGFFIVPFISVLVSPYGYFYFDALTDEKVVQIYFERRHNTFFKLQHCSCWFSMRTMLIHILLVSLKCRMYLFLVKFRSNISFSICKYS